MSTIVRRASVGVLSESDPAAIVGPDACTPEHDCAGHGGEHRHAAGCGHEAVPHGDHTDYLVEDHLHHPHGNHCDDHGPLQIA